MKKGAALTIAIMVWWMLTPFQAASANTFDNSDAAPIHAAYEASEMLGRDIRRAKSQSRSHEEIRCLLLLELMVTGFAGDIQRLEIAITNSALMRDPFDEQVLLVTVRTEAIGAMRTASGYRDIANQLRGACPQTTSIVTYSERATELFRSSYELLRPLSARLGD